jgi:hypothetical protein
LTLEEKRSMLVSMLGEAAESNLDIVLHEDTSGAQPSTAMEHIGRANLLGTSDFRKRIAYVPPARFPPGKHEFIENLAKNHGHEVRVFSHVEDAIKWIECHEADTG